MDNTLFNFLSKNGIDVSKAHGSRIHDPQRYPSYYWGLKENNTQEFIELCLKERLPIIGIDVLVQKNGYYELSFDIWCYQRGINEDDNSYLLNSINGAAEYLKHFHRKDNLLFSFTLGELL